MLERDQRDGVALLTVEHGKANTLDAELLAAMEEALDALEADREVRALVLTGSGGIFSAGVDLFRVLEGGREYLDDFVPRISGVVGRIFRFPKPTVAALNGHAIAGGLVLACACDHRLGAAGDFKLGLTELPVGVPFPWMALEVVRHVVGDRVAGELVMSGGLRTMDEAQAMGLVEAVYPADLLLERAIELARTRGAIPTEAFRLAKEQLQRPLLERMASEAQGHDERVHRVWVDPASHQRIRAFMKRTVGREE